jgi:hypothetical protein
MLVGGRVGTDAALQFQVWLDHYRHIEKQLDALLHAGIQPHDMTMDRQIVCALGACSAVMRLCAKESNAKNKEKHQKEVTAMVNNVFGWLATLSPDVQICAIRSTVDMTHVKKYSLTKNELFMKVFHSIAAAAWS